jgi:hypothetical protein
MDDDFSWNDVAALKEGDGAEWRLDGRWLTTWKDSAGKLITRFMTADEVVQSRRRMGASAAAAKAAELVAMRGVSNGQ